MDAVTREELYLANLNGENYTLPSPVTRKEQFLYNACVRMQQLAKMLENSGGGVSSWNDLTDKPFGEETTVLYEWDGNTEGLEYIDLGMVLDGVSGNIYYKVSDTPLTYDELLGGVGYMNDLSHNSLGTGEVTESMITVDGNVIKLQNGIIMVIWEDTEIFTNVVFTKGIWHLNPNDIELYFSKLEQTTVTQLEEKYIPDSVKLPTVTEADNDKIMKVVDGVWTPVAIANAEEGAY